MLVAGAFLLAALYRLRYRVRWVAAEPGMARVGRFGPNRRLPQEEIRRVFAALPDPKKDRADIQAVLPNGGGSTPEERRRAVEAWLTKTHNLQKKTDCSVCHR